LRGEFENKRQFNKRQIKINQKNEDQIKKHKLGLNDEIDKKKSKE
jgi:hypothetical protein